MDDVMRVCTFCMVITYKRYLIFTIIREYPPHMDPGFWARELGSTFNSVNGTEVLRRLIADIPFHNAFRLCPAHIYGEMLCFYFHFLFDSS